MENKQPLLFRFMQIAWLISIAFVVYLSLRPDIEFPVQFNNIDKIYHFIAYLWLAVVPFFGFHRFRMALLGACFMIPMGVILEFAQSFVPGRFFSVYDMAANTTGVILGIGLGRYLKLRFFGLPRR